MLKSGRDHWGSVAKFFHWTIVLLILTQAVVGLTMVNLPRGPRVIPWYTFHKSVGLTVLALAVLRLAWRLFDPRPAEAAGMARWQALGARIGHALLYGLIFLTALTGWRFDSVAALRPLMWFGLFEVPHLGAPDPAGKEAAAEWHEWMFIALAFVALGHAAMALIHQFVYRDNTLGRMWPDWLQRRPTPHTETAHETSPAVPAPSTEPALDQPAAGTRDRT